MRCPALGAVDGSSSRAARVIRARVEHSEIGEKRLHAQRAKASEDPRLPAILLALTLTTGLIDAASYLGLGHVFTANMTGNVVLLGFGLAHAGGLPVLAPTISLAAFLVGAGAGGRLATRIPTDHQRVVLVGLAGEVTLLTLAALIAAVANVRIGSQGAYALIAIVALAMGLRNAIVRKLAVPDMTTTVLTMTLTGLIADTTAGVGTAARPTRRAGAVLAMLAGACVGGLLVKHSLTAPLLVAAGAGAASLAAYALTHT